LIVVVLTWLTNRAFHPARRVKKGGLA